MTFDSSPMSWTDFANRVVQRIQTHVKTARGASAVRDPVITRSNERRFYVCEQASRSCRCFSIFNLPDGSRLTTFSYLNDRLVLEPFGPPLATGLLAAP